MKSKVIIIFAVLGVIGLVIALAFVGSVTYLKLSSEPWEDLPYWKLTDEERQTAYQIANQNETVKQYLDQGYYTTGHSPDCIYRNDETGITVGVVLLTKQGFAGKTYMNHYVSVYVNLNTGEVAGIDEGLNDIRLTEEQAKKAKHIALSDPEVKEILNGKDYEIVVGRPLVKMSSYEIPIAEGFSVMSSTEELIGASVKFKFTDGTIATVHVSLEKEEVIRISH
ncbi:hypothetical protein C4E22_05665 [ANME-1 cluster archaeon AG-394-G06]|nr:hypothetical protein [ANME-1 cluster archaeon AG-394-G06]